MKVFPLQSKSSGAKGRRSLMLNSRFQLLPDKPLFNFSKVRCKGYPASVALSLEAMADPGIPEDTELNAKMELLFEMYLKIEQSMNNGVQDATKDEGSFQKSEFPDAKYDMFNLKKTYSSGKTARNDLQPAFSTRNILEIDSGLEKNCKKLRGPVKDRGSSAMKQKSTIGSQKTLSKSMMSLNPDVINDSVRENKNRMKSFCVTPTERSNLKNMKINYSPPETNSALHKAESRSKRGSSPSMKSAFTTRKKQSPAYRSRVDSPPRTALDSIADVMKDEDKGQTFKTLKLQNSTRPRVKEKVGLFKSSIEGSKFREEITNRMESQEIKKTAGPCTKPMKSFAHSTSLPNLQNGEICELRKLGSSRIPLPVRLQARARLIYVAGLE